MVAKSSAERKRKQRQLDAQDPDRKHRKLDTLFMFNCVEVAVIIDADCDPWFRGVDLARALEMEEPNVAISLYVDNKYTKSYESLSYANDKYRDIPGMHPKTTFVNEAGMNLFVIRSRMPRAEAFAEWVCAEVLPSIRKTGKYEITNPEDNPYKELNEYLKKQVEELKMDIKELRKDNKDLKHDNKKLITNINRANEQLFNMRPTCIAPLKNELKDEYMVIYRKYNEQTKDDIEEDPELLYLPYYATRVQLDSLKDRELELKKRYPNLELLLKFKLPNSVNFFNYILEEMVDTLERGKGIYSQSFRIKSSIDEILVLEMIKNLYRSQYGKI